MQRNKKVRVKTAKNRTVSSARWLHRQLNDPHSIQAKQDGYFSRAAYKLLELDSKFHILGKGKVIIDLGAAPGSWSQVALKKSPKKIIAVDLLQMVELKGVDFILGDFTDEATLTKISSSIGQPAQVDIILSDMAPNTSGHKDLDHLNIIALCEQALDFAKKTLSKDGTLVMKLFQGGEEKALADKVKQSFVQVKFFKPQASRKDSSEIFLVAIGFIDLHMT
jgi:23S rRNA (uridine2552-2'-O)-methyltransferase